MKNIITVLGVLVALMTFVSSGEAQIIQAGDFGNAIVRGPFSMLVVTSTQDQISKIQREGFKKVERLFPSGDRDIILWYKPGSGGDVITDMVLTNGDAPRGYARVPVLGTPYSLCYKIGGGSPVKQICLTRGGGPNAQAIKPPTGKGWKNLPQTLTGKPRGGPTYLSFEK